MTQGLDLKISCDVAFGAIRDFEDEAFPGSSRKLEILVPLAHQRIQPAMDFEILGQSTHHLNFGNLWLGCRNSVKSVHCEAIQRIDDWFRCC